MIPIDLDEAMAFDMYSILRVKLSKVVSASSLESINRMQANIKGAIGEDLWRKVLESPQYAGLIETNAKLFDLIDAIKGRDPSVDDARAIDQLNYRRYLGKRAIQETFFGTPLSETKIGYDGEGQS